MQAYLAIAILVATLVLFATELFKPSVTAISASLAMCILGLTKPAGFSKPVPRSSSGLPWFAVH